MLINLNKTSQPLLKRLLTLRNIFVLFMFFSLIVLSLNFQEFFEGIHEKGIIYLSFTPAETFKKDSALSETNYYNVRVNGRFHCKMNTSEFTKLYLLMIVPKQNRDKIKLTLDFDINKWYVRIDPIRGYLLLYRATLFSNPASCVQFNPSMDKKKFLSLLKNKKNFNEFIEFLSKNEDNNINSFEDFIKDAVTYYSTAHSFNFTIMRYKGIFSVYTQCGCYKFYELKENDCYPDLGIKKEDVLNFMKFCRVGSINDRKITLEMDFNFHNKGSSSFNDLKKVFFAFDSTFKFKLKGGDSTTLIESAEMFDMFERVDVGSLRNQNDIDIFFKLFKRNLKNNEKVWNLINDLNFIENKPDSYSSLNPIIIELLESHPAFGILMDLLFSKNIQIKNYGVINPNVIEQYLEE